MTDGKTVQLKELPQNDGVAITTARDFISIDIPSELADTFGGVKPSAFVVRAMKHSERSKLKRLKQKVEIAEKLSIRECGVSASEYDRYCKDVEEAASKIVELEKQGGEDCEEAIKLSEQFEDKWDEVSTKLLGRCTDNVEDASDVLNEYVAEVIASNTESIVFDDGAVLPFSIDTVDILSMSLIGFLIDSITNRSNLTHEETLGL